jgi:hypothetical protein
LSLYVFNFCTLKPSHASFSFATFIFNCCTIYFLLS